MSTFSYGVYDANENSGKSIVVPSGLSTKTALMSALSDLLALPPYFHFNWDSLSECLSDPSWLESDRVVMDHLDLPLLNSEDLPIYLEVLKDALNDSDSPLQQVFFPKKFYPEIEDIIGKR